MTPGDSWAASLGQAHQMAPGDAFSIEGTQAAAIMPEMHTCDCFDRPTGLRNALDSIRVI